jgi:SAM-dependent methyltransferase
MNLFSFLSNSHNREVWLKKQLLKIPRGENIIDVGAGEMRYKLFCTHLKYTSQDLGQYEGVGDKVGLQTGKWNTKNVDIFSDILKIPVKKSAYNNVLCTEVLEHVPYPDLAIKEISRILKRGGKLILTATFASQTHFSPYYFFTGFSINWYRKILNKYNLKILTIKPNGNYFDYINQELCRLPRVLKHYSIFSVFSYLLYFVIVPIVLIFWILSKFSNDSEKQFCFGYHVLAVKI